MEDEATMTKRLNDRAFFSWHRLLEAIKRDKTANVEIAVGAVGLILNGAMILWHVTTFPPPDVEFLLRGWGLTESRMGWSLVGIGLLQVLGTGTRSHDIRGVIATIAFMLTSIITTAYIMADLAPYFQAWVGYLGISLCEFFLMVRNWRETENVKDAQVTIQKRVERERGHHG